MPGAQLLAGPEQEAWLPSLCPPLCPLKRNQQLVHSHSSECQPHLGLPSAWHQAPVLAGCLWAFQQNYQRGLLLFQGCVSNHHKLSNLRQHTFIISASIGQKSRRSGFGVSAQGLTGLKSGLAQAGLSPGAQAPLPSSLVVAEFSSFGCRLSVSILCWLSTSQLLEAYHIPGLVVPPSPELSMENFP